MPASRGAKLKKVGFRYWTDRVLKEHANLGGALPVDPVHNLRVALRRCILISEVMRDLDPGSDWKAIRKAGKRLFRCLGDLRDTQVLTGWVEKLGPPGDASTAALLAILKAPDDQNVSRARAAVRKFDRKQWRVWAKELSPRFRHLADDEAACESLILEHWVTVRDLYRQAQKARSGIAYHRFRVGLKKFRYGAENFLSERYSKWEPDLKFLQDLLGEVHDLDVLLQTIRRKRALFDEPHRVWWTQKLREERAARLGQYNAKLAGKSSPLWMWLQEMPTDGEERAAGLARLSQWVFFATPDFTRVNPIARFALQLYDGFSNCSLIGQDSEFEARSILHAAALLQDVGRLNKRKNHHKESYRMIRKIAPPPGWSQRDLEMVAIVARFHRGALPRPDHKILKAYPAPVRQTLILLAALLRLANAFGSKSHQTVLRLDVENSSGVIVVRAEGYRETDPFGLKLSDAKRLLEFACQHPVHILPRGNRLLGPQLVPKPKARQTDAA
jgi:CHAD domain-containing protein